MAAKKENQGGFPSGGKVEEYTFGDLNLEDGEGF